jgi:dipeptidase D
VIHAILTASGTLGLALDRSPVLAQTTAPAGAPSASPAVVPLGDALADLSPRPVWEHFFQLTQIPRPSHHEEQVSAFLADFGRGLGLETTVDEVGNVLIRKPGSPGREDHSGVILQAHMDMVPVKDATVDHDFLTDPIPAVVDDGWVRAEGTTLGADDGIGVALIMALLGAGDVAHGPLEALFTVNEEDGFTGATSLQPGVLEGTMLINVDSDPEGTITIGSAGGVFVDATTAYTEEETPAGMVGVRLTVNGLQGGHSGMDIHLGRGNAIKLLSRLLWMLQESFPLRVSSMFGGDRHNVIPRQAEAVVAVPAADAAAVMETVQQVAATVRDELRATEPDLSIAAELTATPVAVMPAETQERIVGALYGVPNGVIRMSDAVPGLVETSANVGTLAAGDGAFAAGLLPRSLIDSERDDVRQMIASVFDLAGIKTTPRDAYPGWTPNPDSPLVRHMQAAYQDLFGHEAEVLAVHAGLETSTIGGIYPGLDLVSIGPTITGQHSTDERLEIASVGKVYDLLVAVLGRIP